jgi:hypothetical protein
MKLNLITLITINQKPKKIKNITSSLIIILLYEISTLLNNFFKKIYFLHTKDHSTEEGTKQARLY